MNKSSVIVTAVNLFPLRSGAGEAKQAAEVTPNGLRYDRQWRLVTSQGKFLTQRESPQMALLQPSVIDSQLRLSFPGRPEIAVASDSSGAVVAINEDFSGIDQGDEVASWLATALGTDARLLLVNDKNTAGGEDQRRPDMSQVLVISEESLADLNSRLEEPVLMNRFRPNIVVSGLQPYEEESWTRVTIGGVEYVASTEPCGRCSMINIDQERGERGGREPLKTLASYRRTPGAVIFGKYMVPLSTGMVTVGDTVKEVR